jgi:hypothetical protein
MELTAKQARKFANNYTAGMTNRVLSILKDVESSAKFGQNITRNVYILKPQEKQYLVVKLGYELIEEYNKYFQGVTFYRIKW